MQEAVKEEAKEAVKEEAAKETGMDKETAETIDILRHQIAGLIKMQEYTNLRISAVAVKTEKLLTEAAKALLAIKPKKRRGKKDDDDIDIDELESDQPHEENTMAKKGKGKGGGGKKC